LLPIATWEKCREKNIAKMFFVLIGVMGEESEERQGRRVL